VVPIELPPLRARREDIPALVEHVIGQVCADNDRKPKRVAPSAMTLIMQHDWPGNVRELKNVVERLAILTGDAEVITEADVGDALPRVKAVKSEFARGTPFKDLVSAAEREIIMAALEANDHHVSNTARELQLERSHLYKKMRRARGSTTVRTTRGRGDGAVDRPRDATRRGGKALDKRRARWASTTGLPPRHCVRKTAHTLAHGEGGPRLAGIRGRPVSQHHL